MTVRELIEELKKCDPEAVVAVNRSTLSVSFSVGLFPAEGGGQRKVLLISPYDRITDEEEEP